MISSLPDARDRCRGFLVGTAIGDAMGVPFEGLPPAEGLDPADLWAGFATPEDDAGALPGRTSDDTQLTALVMMSLDAQNGVDPDDLARLLSRELESRRTRGWGVSTLAVVGSMVYERRTWREASRAVRSAGNGAAMRSGPIGIFPWSSQKDLASAAALAARVTHSHPDAIAGAVSIASAHAYLVRGGRFSRDAFRRAVVRAARPVSATMAETLDQALASTDHGDVLGWLSGMGAPSADRGVGHRGIPAHAVPSVTAALTVFAAFPSDPATSLGTAVLAGGDTDTVASMVGGLVGSAGGFGVWPERLRENVQDCERLLVIADSFAEACWRRGRELDADPSAPAA